MRCDAATVCRRHSLRRRRGACCGRDELGPVTIVVVALEARVARDTVACARAVPRPEGSCDHLGACCLGKRPGRRVCVSSMTHRGDR